MTNEMLRLKNELIILQGKLNLEEEKEEQRIIKHCATVGVSIRNINFYPTTTVVHVDNSSYITFDHEENEELTIETEGSVSYQTIILCKKAITDGMAQ